MYRFAIVSSHTAKHTELTEKISKQKTLSVFPGRYQLPKIQESKHLTLLITQEISIDIPPITIQILRFSAYYHRCYPGRLDNRPVCRQPSFQFLLKTINTKERPRLILFLNFLLPYLKTFLYRLYLSINHIKPLISNQRSCQVSLLFARKIKCYLARSCVTFLVTPQFERKKFLVYYSFLELWWKENKKHLEIRLKRPKTEKVL